MAARWIGIPITALIVACAGLTLATTHAQPANAPPSGPQAAEAQAVEALAKKSGCFDCHDIARKGIGPSFRDIAAKYTRDARARDALIRTVKRGGKGNWTELTGGVPMPPYSPRLSDADIERLVEWTLARHGERR